ncbi:gamma-glutamyl-gamma-aminobutyrate hydrolase family protein [uncultured Winogradskyella sp.]|uniref:glutamine amidotransferase-related protein n=1 Tax=uncultured Winogradskyella sp. TaxID=395353 RepID=UPI003514D97C
MKAKSILIINNMTHFIADLERALSHYDIEIIDFQAVKPEDTNRFDCIVLSGGGGLAEVAESKESFKNEIKIIRESNIPIFGICEGFQVIGAAYDSDFRLLKDYRRGINRITILKDDPIFKSLKTLELRAFEYHHIAIEHLGKGLIPLAISSDGIEVIRHENKLIYASQFHPEELQEGNDGLTILQNFLAMV